jgi:hypothetical protein
MKKSVQKAALTGGIVWGLGMFVITLVSMATGYGTMFLNMMASIYPGFSISFIGAIIGLIYGFLDVFVFVYILNWVYNRLSK